MQLIAVSSSTPEGKLLIDLLNQQWLERSSNGGTSNFQVASASLPTDPYLPYQWNLQNVGQIVNFEGVQNIFGVPGQDINVVPVWLDGITGAGVVVAVVDTGVITNHPDLAGQLSAFSYNALTGGTNSTPSSTGPAGAHGTQVAGLIAAAGNNGIGTVGVAYGAQIVPIKFLVTSFSDPPSTTATIANALIGNGIPIDVFNHSWQDANGRAIESDLLFFDPSDPNDANLLAILESSATTGRGGLGAIHVFSAGNNAGPVFSPGFPDIGILDSASTSFFNNSRYTISVGAVDHDGSIFNADGSVTLYGEAGPSVLIVAPTASGPFDIVSNIATGSGIWTTDLLGNNGSNQAPLPSGEEIDYDKFPDTNYTSRFGGTSAAAPMVSGVIALMLEANPNLSYRDVQEILVRSARQNDPFDLSWAVNAIPLFRDPVPPLYGGIDEIGYNIITIPSTDPEGDPTYELEIIDPTYHPILGPLDSPVVDPLFTNGAGYTVSYGRYGQFSSEYGYAHGVVDAALAVELAKQWHEKDQHLAPELTYLDITLTGSVPIQAAETSSDETGKVRIPGGLGVGDGFLDYFEEFFVEPTIIEPDPEGMPPTTEPTLDPDSLPFGGDDPPEFDRGSYIVVQGPSDSNAMAVEWVEVQLDITGGGNDLDFLRITLVSPDGTHSELTNYQLLPDTVDNSFQAVPDTVGDGLLFTDPPGELDDDVNEDGTFSWIYSSNHNWGERGEGEWRIYFENYSNAEMSLDGLRVSFHGKPIGVPNQEVSRILGKVGVDAGFEGIGVQDGIFEFGRLNPNFEPYGSNVTVIATDTATGQVVARFITGADGNYYFDLPTGEYAITIDDPLDRDALLGTNYAPNWLATVASGFNTYDGFNFLLDPGPLPANQVVVQGQVFADLNGNGTQDPQDAGVLGFLVYADLNHTGQREASEPFVLTDQNGDYTLTIPTFTYNTFSIGVEPLEGWEPTYPEGIGSDLGFHHLFIGLGGTFGDDPNEDANFGFAPPSAPTGQGNGNVFGFIYDDKNGDGIQQAQFGELGLPDVRVFIDANMDGNFDDGDDISTFTNATGAFTFFNVAPGMIRIDAVVQLPLVITAPMVGYRDVTVSAGQVVQGVIFGIQNLAVNDFGDLVGPGFRTTLGEDGPRHLVIPGFQLGAYIDAELDTNTIEDFEPAPLDRVVNPALHGIGDDLVGPEDDMSVVINDEDGVSIVGGFLRTGSTTFVAMLQGVGGYLNAWVDLNDDGDFDDTVEGISEHVIVNIHRSSGTNQFEVSMPTSLNAGADGVIAARFRWGNFGINYFGADTIGEVEDYLFESTTIVLGDYDLSGYVDEDDFLYWRSRFGNAVAVPGTGADGNADGMVDAADYAVWRDNLGAGTPPEIGAGAGSGSAAAVAPEVLSGASQPYDYAVADASYRQALANLIAGRTASRAGSSAYNAWLQQSGLTSVTVNGPNGPELHFAYTATSSASPSSPAASGPSVVTRPSRDAVGLRFDAISLRSATRFDAQPSRGVNSLSTARTASAANTSLGLLDQVLADFVSVTDDDKADDEYFSLHSSEEDDSSADLALAAVFSEEESWRPSI